MPRIEPAGDGERLVMPIGTLTFDAAFTDIDQRLASMTRWGIERQLLSLPGLFGVDSLPFDEAAPLTRLFNDELAALCRREPQRFSGLAALPLADLDAASAELRRACGVLGLKGAILPVDGFVSRADAERLRALFEVADGLGAQVFVHPGRRADSPPPAAPPDDCVIARRALAVQADVAEAMTTLLLSDFLDDFPRVSVHVANLGGTFAAVVERMDHMTALRAPLAVPPSTRAHRVTVDCASLGPLAIEQAVAVFGAERVVLGTDCPIFDTPRTLAAIGAARLTPAERTLILRGNAQRMLDGSPTRAR